MNKPILRFGHKVVLAAIIGTMATPSYAYVDPGTGAMLLQMAAAGIAGAIFYFRSAVSRVIKRLTRNSQTPSGHNLD